MTRKGQCQPALPFIFHVRGREDYAKITEFMPAVASSLPELLHRVFGHREFRAHQQPVCEAAAAGRDVLLVMPTGAGKSLCYQLPALARGGTALVISPLIALMDDQAAKLEALNLRVARIHSGLPREAARQACRDYLEGNLDFLFIAPERLRVPGFPEMLARRKPALIAIDEAHCISQWGHDFRPDYRTLGQHLPALRPAPIIALTATATPTVQQDILRALNLRDPAVFITGFRRGNLQIEVAELSKPERTGFITKLLGEPAARPAIVYAASRKSAEEIAGALSQMFPTAAYHAGLDPGTRERVQKSFLSGGLEVVVATIAFGMGVDKADVRTVLHAALPGSVEAYYQEIGRAGRDGKPSRAILLHSFADRKMHDFFLERDYPAVGELGRIAAALETAPLTVDELQGKLRMERETVERAVEKLMAQGAASIEPDGTICRSGDARWQDDYAAQVNHRREQIDRMVAFTEGTGCRMAALVRHFGDAGDGGRACGHCDSCDPQRCTSSPAHTASSGEKADLLTLLNALKTGGRSTGKLFTDLNITKDRKEFDRLIDGLSRAGLLHIATESFRAEDGRDITFRKASLTAEGRTPDDTALATVWLRGETQKTSSEASQRGSRNRSEPKSASPPALDPAQLEVLNQLKEWRLNQARTTGAPAFTVFHDSVLHSIAAEHPANVDELGAVRGVGPEKLDRFGAEILAICRGAHGSSDPVPRERQIPDTLIHSVAERKTAERKTELQPKVVSLSAVAATADIRSRPARKAAAAPGDSVIDGQLDARLRDWRREQAAQSGLPTFFILSETALRKVVAAKPQTVEELGIIAEIGADKLARYGPAMVALCHAG